MNERIISGTTPEKTSEVLAKASELINEYPDAVRFKKEKCKQDGYQGLDYSVVKANDGRYFLLGHHNKSGLNKNHFLGAGAFSQVRVAYELERGDDSYSLGKDYVVKKSTSTTRRGVPKVDLDKFKSRSSRKTKKTQQYESESATDQLFEKYSEKYNIEIGTHLLFTERAPGDNLLNHFVKGSFEDVSLADRLHYIVSLAGQLDEKFHSVGPRGSVHRDLKPQNIMVDLDTKSTKIIDVDGTNPEGKYKNLKKVSILYLAPESAEIYTPELSKKAPISKKQDIYALGIIFSEILFADEASGKYYENHPAFKKKFAAITNKDSIKIKFLPEIKRFPELSKRQSKELKDFLSKMTARNPEERPDIKDVVDFFEAFSFRSNPTLLETELQGLLNELNNDALNEAVNCLLMAFQLSEEQAQQIPEALKADVLSSTYDLLKAAKENNDPDSINDAIQNYQQAIDDVLKNEDLDSGLKEQIAGSMMVILGVTSLMFAAVVLGALSVVAFPALLAAAPAIIVGAASSMASLATALLPAVAVAEVVGGASLLGSIGLFSKGGGKSVAAKEVENCLTEEAENIKGAFDAPSI